MFYVVLPQATRNILPQIGNNLIINIKDTCVLSVIGIVELFFATKSVTGAHYTYFEPYTITMIMYLAMTLFFSRLLRWMEKKMDGPQNYDLATTDQLAHTSGMYSHPGKGPKNERDDSGNPPFKQILRREHRPARHRLYGQARRRHLRHRGLRLRQVHAPALHQPA